MSHSPPAGRVTAVGGVAGDGGAPAEVTRIIPAGATAGRRLTAGVLLPVLAAAVAVTGLREAGAGGVSALQAVTAGLIVAWAASAVVAGRARERTPQWQVAAGSLVAAIAFAASRIASRQESSGGHTMARAAAALAAPLVIAVSVHLLLGLPDGRLGSQARRAGTGLAYAAAAGTGIVLALGGRPFPVAWGAVAWPLALACALPAGRLRYLAVAGRDRERMQWAAAGGVLAGTAALAVGVLHLLVSWPAPVAAVTCAATVLIPLAIIAGDVPALGPAGGRFLVQVLATAGFAVTVSAI
jgi:hypothetical protein